MAGLHDGLRPFLLLCIADGDDEAEHAAPRRLALHGDGLVVDRVELYGVRGKAIVQQGAAGLLGIGKMIEDTDQGRSGVGKGAGGGVYGQAF